VPGVCVRRREAYIGARQTMNTLDNSDHGPAGRARRRRRVPSKDIQRCSRKAAIVGIAVRHANGSPHGTEASKQQSLRQELPKSRSNIT